jgi:hypothetical protein
VAEPILTPLKPIPMKDRVSVLFVEKGQLDVLLNFRENRLQGRKKGSA